MDTMRTISNSVYAGRHLLYAIIMLVSLMSEQYLTCILAPLLLAVYLEETFGESQRESTTCAATSPAVRRFASALLTPPCLPVEVPLPTFSPPTHKWVWVQEAERRAAIIAHIQQASRLHLPRQHEPFASELCIADTTTRAESHSVNEGTTTAKSPVDSPAPAISDPAQATILAAFDSAYIQLHQVCARASSPLDMPFFSVFFPSELSGVKAKLQPLMAAKNSRGGVVWKAMMFTSSGSGSGSRRSEIGDAAKVGLELMVGWLEPAFSEMTPSEHELAGVLFWCKNLLAAL
ncbi:hypothetical protein AC578_1397 [Pseudocercospora eumusae]|uniref:Uncharacterized protein n=1 Tax=Pseudocercospora eumusae TaxID=321146 RepID=A0A139HV23_9PEZI|nr:hypothetical protein AC578_1397 [Pseudocercospora eumusae]